MRGGRVSFLFAALLWMISVYEIALIPLRWYRGTLGETPVIGLLLGGTDQNDRIIPLLVLGVFLWILLEVLFHAVRILSEQNGVIQLRAGWSTALSKNLPGRAGARVQLVRTHLSSSPETLRDALPAASSLDEAALENSYGQTKAYIWILPVLGFIGTAWGMAHSIAGFSQALKETQDVQALTDRLGQLVIPGLANAFAVTMTALAASIVGHFCLTTIQAWDAAVLHDLDEISVALLSSIPGVSHTTPQGGGISPGDLQQLFRYLDEISSGVKAVVRQLDLGPPAKELSDAADQLSEAADALTQSATLPYSIKITRGERAGV